MLKVSKRLLILTIVATMIVAAVLAGAVAFRSPQARKQRYWYRAEAFLKAGKRPQAAVLLEEVVQIDPRSSRAYLELGRTYLGLERPRQALRAFSKAVELDPTLMEAQLAIGRLLLSAGSFAQARDKAQLVVQANPTNYQGQLQLAESYAGLKQWDRATQILEGLLQRNPPSLEARFLLGNVYLQQGKFRDAVIRYQSVVDLAPKNPWGHYGLGVAAHSMRHDELAVREFEAALALKPDMIVALKQIVSIYSAQHNPTRAMVRVREQIARSPKDPQYLDLLGLMYMSTGDTAQAERSFARAIEVAPNFPSSYLLLGQVYARNKLYELAGKKFAEAARVNPRDALAYMELGVVQDLQGHFEQAKAYYEKAVELRPSFAPALNNLAWYYAEHKGDFREAQRYATQAESYAPDDPYVSDTQGWIYYKQGRYSDAVPYFARSAKRLTRDPVIRFHLGMAYLRAGRKELGSHELREALRLSSDFPGAAEATKALVTQQ